MVGALPRYDLDMRTGNARNRNRMTSVHSLSAFGEAFGQVGKRDATMQIVCAMEVASHMFSRPRLHEPLIMGLHIDPAFDLDHGNWGEPYT